MRDNGYDVDKMWNDIDDVIIKTLISAHAVLKHNYRTCFPNHVKGSACFEILGFDVMIDRKLKPYLVEVNEILTLFTFIWLSFFTAKCTFIKKKSKSGKVKICHTGIYVLMEILLIVIISYLNRRSAPSQRSVPSESLVLFLNSVVSGIH